MFKAMAHLFARMRERAELGDGKEGVAGLRNDRPRGRERAGALEQRDTLVEALVVAVHRGPS